MMTAQLTFAACPPRTLSVTSQSSSEEEEARNVQRRSSSSYVQYTHEDNITEKSWLTFEPELLGSHAHYVSEVVREQ